MIQKPERIVPIRDRRQHRRVLTLKNFSYVAVALIMFFAGLTLQSNMKRSDSGNYGRILGKQVSGHAAPIEPKKAEIVTPTIEDQTSADPTLVQPQTRAQWLGVDPVTTTTVFPTDTSAPAGITITRTTPQTPQPSQPTLSGGIFRQ